MKQEVGEDRCDMSVNDSDRVKHGALNLTYMVYTTCN